MSTSPQAQKSATSAEPPPVEVINAMVAYDGRPVLRQDPLFKIATSAEYTFRPGFRANISYGYDYGGEATVNDVEKDNRQQNEAWAMSLTYPLSPTAGVKLAWIQTKTKDSAGLDSESLAVGFIFSF